MIRNKKVWIGSLTVSLLLGGLLAFLNFNLTALNDPGEIETYIATRVKKILIGRSARSEVPQAPVKTGDSLQLGRGLFVGACSSCHGTDGITPTDIGQRMYPRAADLSSHQVQQYSDEELYWIIKNGIRLTGMPGLGDSQPDENIWSFVEFIRTLPDASEPTG